VVGPIEQDPVLRLGPVRGDVRLLGPHLQGDEVLAQRAWDLAEALVGVSIDESGDEGDVHVRDRATADHGGEGKTPKSEMMNETVRNGGMFSCG
jgi:hypothetical protein